MLTTIEKARLAHQFIGTASVSNLGDGIVGVQIVSDEIVVMVKTEADAFSGTFGEFPVRSVVVGEIEVEHARLDAKRD